jgi:hypothetical protein
MVRPVAAALMQGPSPMLYCMSSMFGRRVRFRDGVRPVRFEQGQLGAVGPGDGLHREGGHVGQQDFQVESCRGQVGQRGQALGKIPGLFITEGGLGMFIGIGGGSDD